MCDVGGESIRLLLPCFPIPTPSLTYLAVKCVERIGCIEGQDAVAVLRITMYLLIYGSDSVDLCLPLELIVWATTQSVGKASAPDRSGLRTFSNIGLPK